jgi:hypothetical protein
MIVDGDVETLDAGAWVAHGAIAGGGSPVRRPSLVPSASSADAGALEAAQLLDVEVEEIAWRSALVADDGRLGRFERREPVEPVTTQDAGESGLGNWQHHHDLSIGTALPAQSEDVGFEIGRRPARLAKRDRRAVLEALREAGLPGASEPSADGLFADAKSGGGSAQGAAELEVLQCHLGSRERGERGISVHVVRAGGRWVECASTTSLPNPSRADNVLKHDT